MEPTSLTGLIVVLGILALAGSLIRLWPDHLDSGAKGGR